MNRELISSRVVLTKASMDFNLPDDNYFYYGMIWIGDALMQLQLQPQYLHIGKTLTLTDMRAVLPCRWEAIEYVEDEAECKVYPLNSTKVNKYTQQNVEEVKGYWIEGNILHVNYDTESTITIHYLKFPTDDEGFPMIPKSGYLIEALSWYILTRVIARGYNHPTFKFDYADAKWELYSARASNDVRFPSPEASLRFKNMWVQMIPDFNAPYRGFRDAYTIADADNDISDFTSPTIGS